MVQRLFVFIGCALAWSISTAQSLPSSSDFDVLYEEAQAAMSAGDRSRAVNLLERVVQLNPQSAGALLDLALL
ncbi:MAG: tetratricopeptide repeat protein, partial [Betaproteobacteria bacterium]|nr:tetratricopeptide repeat protein [Betaproteobacteria bacterium]